MRALAALVTVLSLAACAPSTVDAAASPGRSCLAPASPVATYAPSASPAATHPPSGAPVARIPDLALECLAGDGVVRLAELHRPAVINLWASWCDPCRAELPAFQEYANRLGDQVIVLGVDTGDTRAAGSGLVEDLKISYPHLFDDQRRLLSALGRSALPVTLFVDAHGGLRYVYNSTALDEPAIARLARIHLGIPG
jgi:thiol-disulfide isomerase/thioredoxin